MPGEYRQYMIYDSYKETNYLGDGCLILSSHNDPLDNWEGTSILELETCLK